MTPPVGREAAHLQKPEITASACVIFLESEDSSVASPGERSNAFVIRGILQAGRSDWNWLEAVLTISVRTRGKAEASRGAHVGL